MSDVSRETDDAPSAPPVARRVFSSTVLSGLQAYVDHLAGPGIERGLIGPRERPRLWSRHVLNCAALGEVLPGTGSVLDVGSGAGLPGVVVAILRPDLRVTLVEPLLRRTVYLEEIVAELDLTNVEVVRARAEDLHGGSRYGVVTSRAVAPLPRLLGWSMPLVAEGGAMLALKGAAAAHELAECAELLERAGCTAGEVRHVSPGGVAGDRLAHDEVDGSADDDLGTNVIRVEWRGVPAVSWPAAPRTSGARASRPRTGRTRGRGRR